MSTGMTREQVRAVALALRDLNDHDGSLFLSDAMHAVRKVIEDRGGDVGYFDALYDEGDLVACRYPEPGEG